MTQRKVIVVGGGAAGLLAAGCAAQAGAQTLLLEKMNRPGRKLAITGKGRCNLTNSAEVREFLNHFGVTGLFLRQAFARFFNTELMSFFEGIGVPLTVERGGRVFPTDGKATAVVAALLRWVAVCGVETRTAAPVEALRVQDGRIVAVVCGAKELACDAVVLATGGASYPATGSTGDGYLLAQAVGHHLVPIRPALVPLVTAGTVAGKMAELNLRNAGVTLWVDGRKRRQAFGELTFAPFGVTGPVTLTLSGEIVDLLQAGGHRLELAIDLKPALDEAKLDARLERDFTARPKEAIDSVLRALLPAPMVPVCLDLTGILPGRQAGSLNARERLRLRQWLKDFRLEVVGHRPMAEAIVTAGGIDTREVDPRSMESRLVKGLFFAGEILDLQGDTGGYNLQAAFSTGWLAGRHAAQLPAEPTTVLNPKKD